MTAFRTVYVGCTVVSAVPDPPELTVIPVVDDPVVAPDVPELAAPIEPALTLFDTVAVYEWVWPGSVTVKLMFGRFA